MVEESGYMNRYYHLCNGKKVKLVCWGGAQQKVLIELENGTRQWVNEGLLTITDETFEDDGRHVNYGNYT